MSDFDGVDGLGEIDDDFTPIPREEQVAGRLARHESHELIAEALGIPRETVAELATLAFATWRERRAAPEEELAAIHWAVDDVLTRLVAAVDRDPLRDDTAALFRARLEGLRLKSELIRAEGKNR